MKSNPLVAQSVKLELLEKISKKLLKSIGINELNNAFMLENGRFTMKNAETGLLLIKATSTKTLAIFINDTFPEKRRASLLPILI